MNASNFKLKLPTFFSYHNEIKSPDELGVSDAGNNAALKRDGDAIFGYVGGIFSGNKNNVFKTDSPMLGDKQFFNTGAQCIKSTAKEVNNNINTINPINISSSNQDQSKLTDRYSYIDNISKTSNNQPVGLLYQVIDDIMDLNPTEIFNSILEPPNSQCIPVTLKTIKQNMNYDIETGFETQYVIVSEIEKINPCNFSDGVNPFITEKTNAICDLKNSKQISIFNEYDTERKNITKETFSNITYPKNNLIQLYLFFVLILFFYLFYKLNYK